MKAVVNDIRLSIDHSQKELEKAALNVLGVADKSIKSIRIIKESVDARRKNNISMVYSVLVETIEDLKVNSSSNIRLLDVSKDQKPVFGNKKINNRPIIVGSGPAGIFAGLVLAKWGYKPIVIERGHPVDIRIKKVEDYWKRGIFDPETNVQFGEGGAGTFSDGKLTTRINDERCKQVLEEYYEAGAGEEILYKAKPHIGTDVLRTVAVNLRKKIEALGGEVRFNSKMTSLLTKEGRVVGLKINDNEIIDTNILSLAIGHSARDTFEALLKNGVVFNQKPFSIGLRIEHPQSLINNSQYGQASGHPRLGPADYQLFYKTNGRTVYTFCMCPGGMVVASASEPGTIVTNGMSEYARNMENANSAFVVSVEPKDFESGHPLAGMYFQRKWEELAYKIAGSDNSAPVQRLQDFISGVNTGTIGIVKPSYTGNTRSVDLNMVLPPIVTDPMKEAIGYFDRRLKGFGIKDALLTGVETRTSSPVRIVRDDNLEAQGIVGLYPAGEGAGYAGGIVSAAVDGIRIAEKIMEKYAPPI